jgi:hypothetical protein
MRRIFVVVAALALTVGCKRGPKSGSVKDLVTRSLSFEGEIDMEIRTPSTPSTHIGYKMKGQKARVNSPMGGVIADLASKKMYILNDAAKTYTVYDFGAIPRTDAGAPAHKKTGKKDVVAGYDCDEYEWSDTGGRTESCMTTALYGPFVAAAGALGAFDDDAGFPLRTVMRDASGAEVLRSEVTRIEKRPVSESDLTVPPGYKESP